MPTVAAGQPPGRYSAFLLDSDGHVNAFREKPRGDDRLINSGFFVISPKCLSLIAGDHMSWESEPLEKLTSMFELIARRCDGF